jgi:hypothetical protein
MKALVDPLVNMIHGVYLEPLTFDISAHYVIDISGLIGGVTPDSDGDVADLVGAKNNAWLSYSGISGGVTLYDELLATPNVDALNSSGIISGPNKRTVIFPGGTLLTNPLPGPGATKACFLHYAGFILYRADVDPNNPTNSTPGPAKMLYSYNPDSASFETFQNSTFTVSVCGASSPFTNISTPIPDVPNTNSVAFPASFRLKFVNNSSLAYHLSDWILIHG